MKIYPLQLTEPAFQYLVAVLMKQPLGEAGPLFEDLREQARAFDAAKASAAERAIADRVRAEVATEQASSPGKASS